VAGIDIPQFVSNVRALFLHHRVRHQDGGEDEISLEGLSGEPADTVNKSLFDANTILKADTDGKPEALTVAETRLVGRISGGEITALTPDQVWQSILLSYVTANGITLNNGNSADDLGDLQTLLDGNQYHVNEEAGAPGYDLEVDFASVTTIRFVLVRAYYDGLATHACRIQLYNYDDTAWDTIDTLYHGLDHQQRLILIPDDSDYISGGAAIVRFYHTEAGNAAHDLYVDYCGLIA
jgi:hypothetical protein